MTVTMTTGPHLAEASPISTTVLGSCKTHQMTMAFQHIRGGGPQKLENNSFQVMEEIFSTSEASRWKPKQACSGLGPGLQGSRSTWV